MLVSISPDLMFCAAICRRVKFRVKDVMLLDQHGVSTVQWNIHWYIAMNQMQEPKVCKKLRRELCFFDRGIKVVVSYLWLPCVASYTLYVVDC